MTRILVALLTTLFFVSPLEAQKLNTRISPALQLKTAAYFEDAVSQRRFIIEMPQGAQPPTGEGAVVTPAGWNIYFLTTTPAGIWKIMNSSLPYLFLDEQPRPQTETGVLIYDMTANRVNAAWNEYGQLRGEGQVVSVKENRMDTNDIDLTKRYVSSPLVSPITETHATAMTTLIAGAGNSFYTGRGVAPKARYSSSDFINVLPDTSTYYTSLGIEIQNHSYGTGLQNFYGINARAFDLSAQDNQNLLHIFSAGNSGGQTPGLGIYAGLRGFANVTGNMKMAKNVLLAGAMDSSGQVPALSSRGPLYDGRVAPHVIAFGEDGTSGAAAITSGVSLLLQQQFKQQYNRPATAALIRAVLVNSADDIYGPGPDYISGFGKLNAVMALRTIKENRFFNDDLAASASREQKISVPAGMAELKLSLAWTDPAPAAGSDKALLNDLDLELISPSGTTLLPWTLSIYPASDSLLKPAARRRDTLNTIEQISITDPEPGEYIIRVRSGLLRTARQSYSLAYQQVAKNSFTWTFPLRDELALAGNEIFLRWASAFAPGTMGLLEVSRNQGPWLLVSNSVNLEAGYFPFKTGDSLHQLSFRITAGAASFASGDLLLSPAMVDRYGYICDTTILHYWNKVAGSTGYRLYRLAYDSMQGILTTADTTAITSRAGGVYFSLAPLFQGKPALRGQVTDYTKQGVGCFIDNFLVDLQPDNTAVIRLTLGSLFKIKKVELVKLSSSGNVLFKVEPPASRNMQYIDRSLTQGMNTYQALVYLDDGTVIKSSALTIYYLNNSSHLLYPNPAVRGQDIHIVSNVVEDELALVYDNNGRLISELRLDDKVKLLPTHALPQGIYHIRIMEGEKLVRRMSFIVR